MNVGASNNDFTKSSTRDFSEVGKQLETLKPGDKIKISRQIRVNSVHSWSQSVEGTYSHTNHLRTGLATDRIPEDDIVVTCIHLTKDSGEKTSITVDEFTKIEKLLS
jgi:hypothetical protein